ncbi:XRE family transcriptional regulator [Pseudomonas kairouanensis]|uniref:XRE family transcriptional regulator n=1 Tax=Pseudomonas kairouanensis TaxID=2293832 RepID=A0A4Z0B241_9PSED|nr:XRE family transcriptional regulator [Pseudomonas kairouanensis]TFY92781.1 XRE family transcriptional regulator [Pseudomonas kairouanensis]
MDTLGSRIQRIRKQKRLSQKKLAQACGWESQSRIGNYESDLRKPSIPDLQLIAPALGVSLSDLLEGIEGSQLVASQEGPTENEPVLWGSESHTTLHAGAMKEGVVPVVGSAKLGADGYFEALDFPTGHGDGYLHIYSDDPNAYGLRVMGDSMHPRIKNGEYVLIEPNKNYVTGDEVMVQTLDGRSMIKEFIYLRDGIFRFDSVNRDHSPLHLDQNDVSKVHLVGGILKSSRFTHE